MACAMAADQHGGCGGYSLLSGCITSIDPCSALEAGDVTQPSSRGGATPQAACEAELSKAKKGSVFVVFDTEQITCPY